MEKTPEKKKQFSRRHATGEAHKEAQATYLAEHGREAHQRKAGERKEARDARTPQEQLKVLDERLGVGQGAKKERARLKSLIS